MVDAFSKWPEVIQLHEVATSASQTITQLRPIFARFGIPKQSCQIMGPNSCRQNSKLSARDRVFVIP